MLVYTHTLAQMVLDLNFGFRRKYANSTARIEKRKLFLTVQENTGRGGALLSNSAPGVCVQEVLILEIRITYTRYPFVSVAITIRQQLFILVVSFSCVCYLGLVCHVFGRAIDRFRFFFSFILHRNTSNTLSGL